MPIFLNDTEKTIILREITNEQSAISLFFGALQKRVYERVSWASLLGPNATTIWWHSAAEYLSDAALSYALRPTEELGQWLQKETLNIVRRDLYEWVGPEFRDHSEPFTGHLETAHLSWGVSVVYDLAKNAFDESQQQEIRTALRNKALLLCRRWLTQNRHLANWRSILFSGAMVAAVVLEEEQIIGELLPEFELCQDALQEDGSYGESLQYANYLLLALTFAKEAILRKYSYLKQPIFDVHNTINWLATSMFYTKPLEGWAELLAPERPISTTVRLFFALLAMCCYI